MPGVQMRLWQAMLVVVTHLRTAAEAQDVAATVFVQLSKYDHPLALRYIMEWVLLRVFLAYPSTIRAVFIPYGAGCPLPPVARWRHPHDSELVAGLGRGLTMA